MEHIAVIIATVAAVIALIAVLKPRGGHDAALLQQMDSMREQLRLSLDDSSRVTRESLTQTQALLQQQMTALQEQLQSSVESSRKAATEGLGNATAAVGDIKKHLGRMEESTRRIFEVGQNISKLQDILKSPKLRGGFGEFLLEELLRQILPPGHYKIQHRFKSGNIVDAVINMGNALVPVDAKFPMENFKRILTATDEDERKRLRREFDSDIKKHINDIADKYICPDEGTYDFALMYIPAENVYYEVIISDEALGQNRDVLAHAQSRKVIPVSPNSFYAYLHVIVLGLKGMRIESTAREVLATLGALREDMGRFIADFDKIGTHIGHADGAFNIAQKRINKFNTKLEGVDAMPELPAPDEENEGDE